MYAWLSRVRLCVSGRQQEHPPTKHLGIPRSRGGLRCDISQASHNRLPTMSTVYNMSFHVEKLCLLQCHVLRDSYSKIYCIACKELVHQSYRNSIKASKALGPYNVRANIQTDHSIPGHNQPRCAFL